MVLYNIRESTIIFSEGNIEGSLIVIQDISSLFNLMHVDWIKFYMRNIFSGKVYD